MILVSAQASAQAVLEAVTKEVASDEVASTEVAATEVAATESGCRAGDHIVAWRAEWYAGPPTEGEVAHPMDLVVPLFEAASMKSLFLRCKRQVDGTPSRQTTRTETTKAAAVPTEILWTEGMGLTTRPVLSAEEVELFEVGLEQQQPVPAAWQRLLDRWSSEPAHHLDSLWLAWTAALRARARGAPAIELWRRTLELASQTGLEPAPASDLASALAHKPANAAARAAVVWSELASEQSQAGDVDGAAESYRRAAELLRRHRPGSAALAAVLHSRGSSLLGYGRSAAAIEALAEALVVRQRIAPGTSLLASTLNNLGVALPDVGRVEEGEKALRRSLAIRQRLEPDSTRLGSVLTNLGVLAYQQGDLAAAEDAFRRTKEIYERLVPDSLKMARSLNNLAGVVEHRGELDQAERWHRRALELRERLAPDGLERISSLINLATVRLHRGDAEAAVTLAHQALDQALRVAPGSEAEAACAKTLAYVLVETGDASGALPPARRAAELFERLAPRGAETFDALVTYAETLMANGLLAPASEVATKALESRRSWAPGSRWEADSWRLLGDVEQARGRPNEALAAYRQAFQLVEAMDGLPGETPRERAEAAAEFVEWYRRGVEILLPLGRVEEAFALLEKARARGLMAVLAERRVAVDGELPADLVDRRRRLGVAWEAARRELEAIEPSHDEARSAALLKLTELRDARLTVARQLRQLSPRLAAVEAPQSLDWPEVAAGLGADEALLAYSVGESETWLFVGWQAAEGPRLEAHRVPLGREALRREVTSLRLLLRLPTTSVDEIRRRARALGALLLQPAASAIEGRGRLLVVADRELHRLPFAALVDAKGRWLIENHAVVLAPSASAAMARPEAVEPASPTALRPHHTSPLVAFADPSADRPLPWSRLEVAAIEEVSAAAGSAVRVFAGSAASESRLVAEAPRAGRLHFATHATVDDLFPLDSHLSLAPSSSEDGQLRAWEVFEELRLDADLVTLSGCETGLGRELDGEGLLGLVRAFLFAGARSVLASQWRVEDRSTAALMARFYAGLASGDKAEALRRAQVALATAPVTVPAAEAWWTQLARVVGLGRLVSPDTVDLTHPYYWAAFELLGEWR